ncbi:hypothetical protein ACFX1Q_030058 [Malus domestica]
MKTLNNFIILIFILVFITTSHVNAKWFHKRIMGVQINNHIHDGTKLKVHCKTGDDDFGLHILEDNQEVHWELSPTFWYSTLVYCYVQWRNSPWYRFDAIRMDADWGCDHCYYSMDPDYKLWLWHWTTKYLKGCSLCLPYEYNTFEPPWCPLSPLCLATEPYPTQGEDESLRNYIKRFQTELTKIEGPDTRLSATTFKRWPYVESELSKNLGKKYDHITLGECFVKSDDITAGDGEYRKKIKEADDRS